MHRQISPSQPVTCCDCRPVVAHHDTFTCPVQILVIDQIGGPASILVDTVGLLLNREISVMTVDAHEDAFRALEYYEFDLVVVGIQANDPVQLTILPWLHDDQPERPVLVVGRDLPRQYRQYARVYGAREVLDVPRRAADLKRLVRHLAGRYLDHTEDQPTTQAL